MGRKTVSMLTETMAKEGVEFSPYASEKCIGCRFFNVCIGNLRPGARYRVVKVRSHRNKCPLLSEEMYVVEVEELPVRLVVPSNMAIEGMTITYRKPPRCPDEVKRFGVDCNPPYILEGEKATVKKIVGRLRGGLTVVEAELLDPPKRELWIKVFPVTTAARTRRSPRRQEPRSRSSRSSRPPRKSSRKRSPRFPGASRSSG